ncbi:uncharacterized protein PAC_01028 [Phialocephala subalpina]|uniref:Uncharacterized protein n=1 Tax=Phialocephala subalpina TaxID=576137 RepID=A0A1L7WED6_9HELO|nr:uncharacterized protein PAC_01028 [Phialocephala subalpina]
MAPVPAHEQRCASHISISSGDESPGPRRPSIISISSGGESPRPTKKRRVAKSPEDPRAKDNNHGGRSDEELALEMQQMELMQRWVDEGIQMAIEEMSSGVTRLQEKLPETVKIPILRDPPQTSKILPPGPSAATRHYNSPYNLQSAQAPANPLHAPHAISTNSCPSQQGYATPVYPPQYQGYGHPRAAGVPPQYQPSSQPYAAPPSYPSQYNHAPFGAGILPRPALGIKSTNVVRIVEQGGPQILSPERYLSFYDLENIYCPNKEVDSTRRAWVLQLDLNLAPFMTRYTAAYKRQEVEDTWAHLPVVKRRLVELTAVTLKYRTKVDLSSIPFRLVPKTFLPLTFAALEWQYFNVPERRLTDYQDIMIKRRAWLKDLNLEDPTYHTLCSSPAQEQAVETLYTNSHSVAERRAIEVKAAYLRVMLNPPRYKWAEFENKYFLFSKIKSEKTTDFDFRRRGWLNSLGLDLDPYNICPSDSPSGKILKERLEVYWNDFGPATRDRIEQTARTSNESVLQSMSFSEIEPFIGYSLERDFAGNTAEYDRIRERWLRVINMRPVYLTEGNLNIAWGAKSVAEKESLIGIAKTAKRVIEQEMAAEESKRLTTAIAEKAGKVRKQNLADQKRAAERWAEKKTTEKQAAERPVENRAPEKSEKVAAERWAEKKAARLEAAKLSISKSFSLMSPASAMKKKSKYS